MGPHESGPRHCMEGLYCILLYIGTIKPLSVRFLVFPFVLAQPLSILQLPILPQTFTIGRRHTPITLVVYTFAVAHVDTIQQNIFSLNTVFVTARVYHQQDCICLRLQLHVRLSLFFPSNQPRA